MGLFDNIMPQEQQGSSIDILKDLLNPENIEMKTDLTLRKIQALVQVRYWLTCRVNKDITPEENLSDCLSYYLQLLVSYNRQSREESIKGISEMKDALLNNELIMSSMLPKK